jgi:two-component system, NtrC family, sensor kinase
MSGHSNDREPVKARRRKTVTRKRPNAANARRRRSSSAATHETEVARLTLELKDALEQKTATSEVLRVISSSPSELGPVFQAMLEKATRLCEAPFGGLFLRETGLLRLVASHVPPSAPAAIFQPGSQLTVSENATHPLVRMIDSKAVTHIADMRTDVSYVGRNPRIVAFVESVGARAVLCVPMLKANEYVGAFIIFRQEVRPFTDKQIELVQDFAAQAVIAIENARLLNELRQRTVDLGQRTVDLAESLEQQTATSDVLRVISSSPGELQPVFDAMLENAVRICDATYGNIYSRDGDFFRLVASHKTPPAFAEYRRRKPMTGSGAHWADPMLRSKTQVHIADLTLEEGFIERDPSFVAAVELGRARSALAVPMLKEGEIIGAFALARLEVRPFTEKQIALVTNFASQAVIAIENARLLNELRQRTTDLTESLEQQTATSEVLQVISSSPGDLEPVFATMLENAVRICDANFGNIYRWDGEALHLAATHNAPPAYAQERRRSPHYRPSQKIGVGRMVATKKAVHVVDAAIEPAYLERHPAYVTAVELGGVRTYLTVPMLRENELIGAFTVFRQEVRPFTEKQIALVTNFAAQAVIAIENTRLLNELRESLQEQTATADVLQVISSSPGALQPVFTTILENATRICDAKFGNIYVWDDNAFLLVAAHNTPPAFAETRKRAPFRPKPSHPFSRMAVSKQVQHIVDAAALPAYADGDPEIVEPVDLGGVRTCLAVPMLKEEDLIGALVVFRQEVRAFADKQIKLIGNFAAQAVIAIENTRLLNELRESLQQQIATADVLKVISRSTFDLQSVLDTLIESAARLCAADKGNIQMREGDVYRIRAHYGIAREAVQYALLQPLRPSRSSVTGRVALEGKAIHIPDVVADPEYRATDYQQAFGFRTILGVPLLREGSTIGVFVLNRVEVSPFNEKQIELVATFADQAVIAIENARLLNELRESLQQQSATADVLKVISRSAFDLQTVLDTLVGSAARLCDADSAAIHRPIGNSYPYVASYGYTREYHEYMRERPIIPGRGTVLGRAVTECKPVQVNDVEADPEYTLREGQRLGGFRTVLGIPLLREGMPIGVIVLTRSIVRPFTVKQIELATTFADQAAIAIENVRLFEAEQQRTQELARSIEDLRTTQDRLIQTEKLASLGQLTAGIAHEIKNPLNFVNNFSAVSVELIDELREALGVAHLDSKLRAEVAEIADMLQGNLDKVVQHGKRADSIVKNMLLHSRQGSREHRPVDINALVEESLNLAYHGARAEKQGFNITLERSFDSTAGEVDLFPQEITRVLLNLISNGFYAATKRKAEANEGDYEPMLAAATKNLGDRVEIRIRDNGTGIPPEVKEKLFNPFFTTKPAGEGTGLGLSISHDIIVKQHGGSIEVDTQPGVFTEFRIVLPRAGASLIKSGERA